MNYLETMAEARAEIRLVNAALAERRFIMELDGEHMHISWVRPDYMLCCTTPAGKQIAVQTGRGRTVWLDIKRQLGLQ